MDNENDTGKDERQNDLQNNDQTMIEPEIDDLNEASEKELHSSEEQIEVVETDEVEEVVTGIENEIMDEKEEITDNGVVVEDRIENEMTDKMEEIVDDGDVVNDRIEHEMADEKEEIADQEVAVEDHIEHEIMDEKEEIADHEVTIEDGIENEKTDEIVDHRDVVKDRIEHEMTDEKEEIVDHEDAVEDFPENETTNVEQDGDNDVIVPENEEEEAIQTITAAIVEDEKLDNVDEINEDDRHKSGLKETEIETTNDEMINDDIASEIPRQVENVMDDGELKDDLIDDDKVMDVNYLPANIGGENQGDVMYSEGSENQQVGLSDEYGVSNSNVEQNNSNDEINNNMQTPKGGKIKSIIVSPTETTEYDHLPQSYLNRPPVSALTPVFSFGYNRYVPIINLSNDNRCFIFYSASHLAIVYDYYHNEQMILQGHSNSITCTTASKDKRWLGTGDKGEDSVVIIWDCNTGLPVRSMFEPHPNGVVAISLTPDARYLATVSAENTQTFAVWDWTTGEDVPLCSASLSTDYGVQRYISFSDDDIFHVSTNSESRVLFYQWDKIGNIRYFAPTLTDKDFNKQIGRFSNTVYLPKTTKAITATSQGLLVVWEGNNPLVKVSNESTPDKRAVKLVPVHHKGINVLTLIDSFIVTGDVAGEIKFFDFNFMLIFWYQGWNFGAITSISASNNVLIDKVKLALDSSDYPEDATIEKKKFCLRDFIVGTISTIFATVKVEGSKIKIIFREHDQSVFSVAAHPTLPLVATGSYSGLLKIWDYEQKRSLKTRLFDTIPIKCLCFDHRGLQLAVGFTNGEVRILDTHALQDVTKTAFHFSKVHITHILFSEHTEFLATVDANCTTTVFRPGQGSHEDTWVYLARYRAHYKPVVEMMFGRWFDTEVPRLFTLGQDRRLVEYDLSIATEDNLPIAHDLRIEQRSIPLTMCWYPEEDKEGFLVTANDEYKIKMYNHQTKMCRFTYLGPTFGSPVKILKTLPPGNEHPMRSDGYRQRYVAYANSNKIGLMRLDFDGNPYNYMTMIAHPKGVTNLCCSFDGNYLISVGEDFIVSVWKINVDILETQARLGGSDMAPYYELIEGGEFGMFMHELKDYFYYSMIRTQGIDSLQTRKVDIVIEISEVPYIMRAIGFYPSEEEIENMLNELKYREYYITGECATKVNLDTFLKLYINHRPAFGIHSSKIDEAFRYILKENIGDLTNEKFLDILINRGESILEDDLAEYLATLLGLNPLGGSLEMEDFEPSKVMEAVNSFLPKIVTPKNFIEEMLCMKIVDKESLMSTKVSTKNKAANGTQT